jgi:GDPmannose 4,6-dehydratase
MKRILIIGCEGQDGILLSELLTSSGFEVYGTYSTVSEVKNKENMILLKSKFRIDLRSDELLQVISDINPEVVFFLAGLSSVIDSWENPAETFNVNSLPYFKLIMEMERKNLNFHLIFASSVEIFKIGDNLCETSPLEGYSPYGISKIASTELGRLYRKRGLKISNAILGNHESHLRSEKFVTGKIAKGVAEIAVGKSKNITLGNLNIQKNWTSAYDIVGGLKRISEVLDPDDYILAYPINTSLKELIAISFQAIGINDWRKFVTVDKSLYRNDENIARSFNLAKSKRDLNWTAEIPPQSWMKQIVKFHLNKNC